MRERCRSGRTAGTIAVRPRSRQFMRGGVRSAGCGRKSENAIGTVIGIEKGIGKGNGIVIVIVGIAIGIETGTGIARGTARGTAT